MRATTSPEPRDVECRHVERALQDALELPVTGPHARKLSAAVALEQEVDPLAVARVAERVNPAVEAPCQDPRLPAGRRHDRELQAAIDPILGGEESDGSPVRAPRGRALHPVVVREARERGAAVGVIRRHEPEIGLVARVRLVLTVADECERAAVRRPRGLRLCEPAGRELGELDRWRDRRNKDVRRDRP